MRRNMVRIDQRYITSETKMLSPIATRNPTKNANSALKGPRPSYYSVVSGDGLITRKFRAFFREERL